MDKTKLDIKPTGAAMTDPRTQFLIQVLDKIGGPLASAIVAGPTLDSEVATAQRLAELLNRTVQLGLSMASQMNVRDESRADGVHLSLAAFASPLMASQYLVAGLVPEEQDVRRMTTALQAVLTFADNFTPAADNTRMLQNADGTAHIADEMMLYVHILHAFAPVFQVVTDYAFGKPENKLIQEISIRLMQRSATLRDDLFGAAATEAVRPQIDIVMIKLLCGLYAACHSAEMRRLVNLSDDERAHAVVTIDTVWEAFEKQAEMVSVVAGQIIPIVKADEGSASAGPALLEKSPASPPSGGGNPMAFFGKKKPEAAPAENPATPFRKPAPVAAEKKPGDGAANPMAFFAKKPKNATDGE